MRTMASRRATFAQLYEHEFERFDAQYKALDACYRLVCLTQDSFTPEANPCQTGRALV